MTNVLNACETRILQRIIKLKFVKMGKVETLLLIHCHNAPVEAHPKVRPDHLTFRQSASAC